MMSTDRSVSIIAAIFCLMCLDLTGIPSAYAESGVQSETITLPFPNDYSVGRLGFVGAPELKHRLAKGTIVVPSSVRLELTVSYDGGRRLSVLKKLPPNAIYRLTLRRLEITDSQLEYLQHLRGLELIDLSDTDVTDAGAKYLSKLTNLTSINLRSTFVTGQCLIELSRLPALTSLMLDITNTRDRGTEFLPRFSKLSGLSMTRTSITNDALKHIAKIPNLHNLDLSFNSRITDIGMKHLTASQRLESLSIANTNVTTGSIAHFKRMHSLKHLVYSNNQFAGSAAKRLQAALPKCSLVEVLEQRSRNQNKIDPSLFAPLH